jgi:hypothetical protein
LVELPTIGSSNEAPVLFPSSSPQLAKINEGRSGQIPCSQSQIARSFGALPYFNPRPQPASVHLGGNIQGSGLHLALNSKIQVPILLSSSRPCEESGFDGVPTSPRLGLRGEAGPTKHGAHFTGLESACESRARFCRLTLKFSSLACCAPAPSRWLHLFLPSQHPPTSPIASPNCVPATA